MKVKNEHDLQVLHAAADLLGEAVMEAAVNDPVAQAAAKVRGMLLELVENVEVAGEEWQASDGEGGTISQEEMDLLGDVTPECTGCNGSGEVVVCRSPGACSHVMDDVYECGVCNGGRGL